MNNVHDIRPRPGRREELDKQIALLEQRQESRRFYVEGLQQLLDRRQLEIDNLRAQRDACDEREE